MTSTLPVLTSSPMSAHVGGRHTRNKRAVAVRTCETCPSEVKSACSVVCSDMERHLDGNGGTISHNSPVSGQMANRTVNDLTGGEGFHGSSAGPAPDVSVEGGAIQRWFVGDSQHMGRLAEMNTPEKMILDSEAATKAETLILQHVSAFCENAVKKNDRERSVVESIVVLHYLEGYTINRTAEILGERFEEYAGCRENERTYRSDRQKKLAAPKVEKEPKGRFKVARTLKKFQEYIHTTHLSQALHTVMVTGSVEPVKPFAAKA